jgi:hypothetical protein
VLHCVAQFINGTNSSKAYPTIVNYRKPEDESRPDPRTTPTFRTPSGPHTTQRRVHITCTAAQCYHLVYLLRRKKVQPFCQTHMATEFQSGIQPLLRVAGDVITLQNNLYDVGRAEGDRLVQYRRRLPPTQVRLSK